MLWSGRPEQHRYVLNIWFNVATKIFIVVFLIFWLCMFNVSIFQKLSTDVITDCVAFFTPYIIACVGVGVGIIAGLMHIRNLVKTRISDAKIVRYEVSDENITVKSDIQRRIRLSEVNEVIIVYSWIYGSKEYGDIYFRRSEKEVLTSGLNSVITRPQIPKALGFIAVKNPETAAKIICNALQTATGKPFEYKVMGLR